MYPCGNALTDIQGKTVFHCLRGLAWHEAFIWLDDKFLYKAGGDAEGIYKTHEIKVFRDNKISRGKGKIIQLPKSDLLHNCDISH